MKIVRFEKPGALVVEYKRAKDGPPHFLVWTPGTARICMDRSRPQGGALAGKDGNR